MVGLARPCDCSVGEPEQRPEEVAARQQGEPAVDEHGPSEVGDDRQGLGM